MNLSFSIDLLSRRSYGKRQLSSENIRDRYFAQEDLSTLLDDCLGSAGNHVSDYCSCLVQNQLYIFGPQKEILRVLPVRNEVIALARQYKLRLHKMGSQANVRRTYEATHIQAKLQQTTLRFETVIEPVSTVLALALYYSYGFK